MCKIESYLWQHSCVKVRVGYLSTQYTSWAQFRAWPCTCLWFSWFWETLWDVWANRPYHLRTLLQFFHKSFLVRSPICEYREYLRCAGKKLTSQTHLFVSICSGIQPEKALRQSYNCFKHVQRLTAHWRSMLEFLTINQRPAFKWKERRRTILENRSHPSASCTVRKHLSVVIPEMIEITYSFLQ